MLTHLRTISTIFVNKYRKITNEFCEKIRNFTQKMIRDRNSHDGRNHLSINTPKKLTAIRFIFSWRAVSLTITSESNVNTSAISACEFVPSTRAFEFVRKVEALRGAVTFCLRWHALSIGAGMLKSHAFIACCSANHNQYTNGLILKYANWYYSILQDFIFVLIENRSNKKQKIKVKSI